MEPVKIELANDWVSYAKASLQTRIDYTSDTTARVLTSIQEISSQLEDKSGLEALLNLKADDSTSTEVLAALKEVLDKIDTHDTLAQLIYPLFTTLQFEDRTRQKLESIMGMLDTWVEMITENNITEEVLANRLEAHVISAEQQEILARHLPDHIGPYKEPQGNSAIDDVNLF